jgi:hypothetical protein
MPPEERSRSRQAIHDLRAHLATVMTNVDILGFEPELTANGRLALERIARALELARRELEQLGQAARRQDSPLVRMLRQTMR